MKTNCPFSSTHAWLYIKIQFVLKRAGLNDTWVTRNAINYNKWNHNDDCVKDFLLQVLYCVWNYTNDLPLLLVKVDSAFLWQNKACCDTDVNSTFLGQNKACCETSTSKKRQRPLQAVRTYVSCANVTLFQIAFGRWFAADFQEFS